MRAKSSRPHRYFQLDTFECELWRLEDDEFKVLHERSLAIRMSLPVNKQQSRTNQAKPRKLTLPKAYIALEALFGEGSRLKGNPEQAFSFAFLLSIKKSSGVFYYLFEITDLRGGLSFNLYRIADQKKYIRDCLTDTENPIENEFSSEEIRYFIQHLCSHLNRIVKKLCEIYESFEPFVRCIDSERILYGYKEGDFFEIKFEREVDYLTEKLELFIKCHPTSVPPIYQYEETCEVIQFIVEQK
uniref:Uncharacterized protein n=1 Tax=Oscillatoriales cyanobacterium SpSt-418 TaxID=2282169 RepID=A0A7C3KD58_9CYAN